MEFWYICVSAVRKPDLNLCQLLKDYVTTAGKEIESDNEDVHFMEPGSVSLGLRSSDHIPSSPNQTPKLLSSDILVISLKEGWYRLITSLNPEILKKWPGIKWMLKMLIMECGFGYTYFPALELVGRQTDIVRWILQNRNRDNASDSIDTSVLGYASENGNYRVVKHLLQAGIDPNLCEEADQSALQKACWDPSSADHTKTAEILLDAGAQVNFQQGTVLSALHFAARNDHLELMQKFLQCKDIIVDIASGRGTPLSWAASNGQLGAMELLINSNSIRTTRS
ncbi:ankyrin [Lophiostoma macrostomum CBS 122681]|uniref:Ankyrin n=1 Tax=Lophiostoma macrostomum CBS 122681 TaxID=1314788 RepID=A0A6A6SMK5_9PLEO|nr:ankyrin [Lophiostoma macrostomum CBS 122681]